MGAFPSHDTPELIYTTLVPQPTTDTQLEVCLVPLLPRFFNDGQKKAKRKLNDILSLRGTDSSTSSPASGGTPTGTAGKRTETPTAGQLVDCIIACTDPFFLTKTRDAVIHKDVVGENKQKGEKSAEGNNDSSVSGIDDHMNGAGNHSQQQPRQNHALKNSATYPATSPVLRPVPFAVCIINPESSASDASTSAAQYPQSANKQHPPYHPLATANAANILTLRGLKLQIVGFISCCLSRPVHLINPSTFTKAHSPNGGSTLSSLNSSSGDPKKETTPVVLDVIFDDIETYGYLTESVVLLASLAFRKQFINSCALYYPAGDKDVEYSFDYHMERLQLRILLQRNNHRELRMFYSHYPLLDMIKEIGLQEGAPTHFSLYENHLGEHGMEVTFSNKFLASWMRYLEKKIQIDSVKGQYVRCVTVGILQECKRLIQERHNSAVFMEEEEEDERLYGGTLLASALKRWISMGSQPMLTHHHSQFTTVPQMMLFPHGATAPAACCWPQMPTMMMGMPPAWPTGTVMPSAIPSAIPIISGQQPQFILPDGRSQFYYAPQATVAGGGAFFPPPGMQVVSAPGPYTTAAQQVVYVVPGAQMQHAAATATTALPYAPGGPPPMYFAQPPSYGVACNSGAFPQSRGHQQVPITPVQETKQ